MGVGGHHHPPAALPPGKRPGTEYPKRYQSPDIQIPGEIMERSRLLPSEIHVVINSVWKGR
jgi:hypothetical protein